MCVSKPASTQMRIVLGCDWMWWIQWMCTRGWRSRACGLIYLSQGEICVDCC